MKKYAEAKDYLFSIPVKGFEVYKREVFEREGAEIILGLVNTYYENKEYAQVVRSWELYEEKYFHKKYYYLTNYH